jgi:hypothetical protein
MTAINDPAARPPRRGCAPIGTVEFHPRIAPAGTLVLKERSHGSFGIAQLPGLRGHQAIHFDGPVALSKRRHGIVIRVVTGKFVGRAPLKMQLQLALLWFGNDSRVLRQGETGPVFSARLCQKHAVPLRAAGRHVVDVQHPARKALVEHARLYLKGYLRGDQIRFDGAQCAQGQRRKPEAHDQRERGAHQCYYTNGQENPPAPDAECRQGDDFAVGGHTPKAEKHADQNGHGDGKNKNAGKQAKEQLENLASGTGMTDKKLHQADKLRNKKNKTKNDKPKDGVPEDFADDVAVQDAHGANRECSTAAVAFTCGASPTA